jgi:hypothetical protein
MGRKTQKTLICCTKKQNTKPLIVGRENQKTLLLCGEKQKAIKTMNLLGKTWNLAFLESIHS